MPQIDVSKTVYEALKRLTQDFHQPPNDVLAQILCVPANPGHPAHANPLAAYLISPEFRAKFTDADKYLAVLSWIAAQHAAGFSEFIHSLSTGRRYLSLDRSAILD